MGNGAGRACNISVFTYYFNRDMYLYLIEEYFVQTLYKD
jgi:hypothetical protein